MMANLFFLYFFGKKLFALPKKNQTFSHTARIKGMKEISFISVQVTFTKKKR